jgi:hypothetical protein
MPVDGFTACPADRMELAPDETSEIAHDFQRPVHGQRPAACRSAGRPGALRTSGHDRSGDCGDR